ncbi:MAG: hypothetical protein ACFE9L_09055 [Candidatus Hodarchaeota archaeon]
MSNYIKIGFEEKLLSESLKNELLTFNETVRNNLIHPKGIMGLEVLGFKITEYSKLGASFMSPTGEAIHPLTPQKAAELGIDLFLRTVKEILNI